MRVVILHFHLRPGGVTRVIELTCEALLPRGIEPLVLTGEPAPPGCRIPAGQIAVVPALAYGVEASQTPTLISGVDAAIHRHWQAPADILHAHNHSLGKNFALPGALSHWARQQQPLLLQIHDFAESGRPDNYQRLCSQLGGAAGLNRCLYPAAPHVGYALLNSADRQRLAQAGLAQNCELLPNPVSLPPEGEPIPKDLLRAERAIVYPTRAIRRKNIGEALLWASLAAPGDRIILTSAPPPGPDRLRHDTWLDFAQSLGLPLTFDAQTHFSRPAIDFLLGADLALTTSIEEGFGMAFLEPWLAARPLAGRDLPGLTSDFRAEGLALGSLYERLAIPSSWLDARRLENLVISSLQRTCRSYGVPFSENFVSASLASLYRDGHIDFGRLDEELQREIIHGLTCGALSRQAIASLPVNSHEVEANRHTVREKYSLAHHGERLSNIYQRLATAKPEPLSHLDAGRVLHAVLRFDDFFALRC